MIFDIRFGEVANLPPKENALLHELEDVYVRHALKNEEKDKYYEGHISLSDVNLGIALPRGIRGLEIGCNWGAKTVDVLASRSMFDGFVGRDGGDASVMTEIVEGNRLQAGYMKACRDELKYGCTFATLSQGGNAKCKIRFHSPQTAAAKWNGEKDRISCGFAVIDFERDVAGNVDRPFLINFYTDTDIWELRRSGSDWAASRHPHKMGRPLMEPLIWNATSAKPFGRSRLKEPIRRLIEGYVRTIANATIGLEFSTTPQKYLLGITDEQYDVVISQKFRQYVGSILASTTNPETGEKPEFGQLAQGNIAPHVEMIRILATQFSAATGLTVTDTGVVNDANPTSSDAILAQSQTLVAMAEQLNEGNGDSLRMIAQMAQAIARDCSLGDLTDEERNVIPHFKNPAMPSVSVTADAAIKIASARSEFASTDTFLEMIGFGQADIRRIKAQEQRARGQQLLLSMSETEETDEDIEEGLDSVSESDVADQQTSGE